MIVPVLSDTMLKSLVSIGFFFYCHCPKTVKVMNWLCLHFLCSYLAVYNPIGRLNGEHCKYCLNLLLVTNRGQSKRKWYFRFHSLLIPWDHYGDMTVSLQCKACSSTQRFYCTVYMNASRYRLCIRGIAVVGMFLKFI